jgi:Ca-activated chloride channel family protein
LEPASGETLARVAAAVRLQSLGAEEAEAVALAVAYQLVTDRTNFLLVHARAEGEAPTELPELHKVAQMLPAGWGGLGSVLAAGCPSPADSSADTGRGVADGDLSFSLAEPSADLPSPDRPAVYRSTYAACAPASSSEPDLDDLDIPAFLRRQVAPPPPMPPTRGLATGDNRGLTPFGLSEWLRRTPQTQWPRTYAGLRRIGLGSAVLDWLELVIGIDATGPLEETAVVASFLHVLSQGEMVEALAQSRGSADALKAITARLRGLVGGGTGTPGRDFDTTLAGRIASALHGITAEAWPEAVDAMTLGHGRPLAP